MELNLDQIIIKPKYFENKCEEEIYNLILEIINLIEYQKKIWFCRVNPIINSQITKFLCNFYLLSYHMGSYILKSADHDQAYVMRCARQYIELNKIFSNRCKILEIFVSPNNSSTEIKNKVNNNKNQVENLLQVLNKYYTSLNSIPEFSSSLEILNKTDQEI